MADPGNPLKEMARITHQGNIVFKAVCDGLASIAEQLSVSGLAIDDRELIAELTQLRATVREIAAVTTQLLPRKEA